MKDKLVEVVEGKAATTSRIVAEYFNRDHNSVMRAVRNLSVPEESHCAILHSPLILMDRVSPSQR